MAHPLENFLADLALRPRNYYISAYEDIPDDDNNKVYLITWNPRPRFYNYDEGGHNDFDLQWWTMCDTLFKSIRCLAHFAFVPEVSEQGKLHMHGFFTIRDKRKYNRSFLPTLRKNGFIKIAKVKVIKWKTFKYHVKDLKSKATQELMKAYVLTHHTVDPLRKHYTRQKLFAQSKVVLEETNKRNMLLEAMADQGEESSSFSY